MRDAIAKAGRPMVFSICEWGMSKPWEWAGQVGHSWRTTPDLPAVNAAIAAAAAAGTVYFPPGRYLSASIRLKSNITLYLEAGALIEAVDE
ncbi:hypothetical protein [Pseudoduganella namucuonensis]|uniref:Pectate lyase superfamily protein domain-containing protein n=1 Tax=Pseudoduganella namucuonensis TaxID=1035707 RepID=A0A1I7JA66_9BURK|nr:hypothetical protein [Pseudoduganella namucuonensis]SFU82023.1 hypothetical protein SAMN05216552_1010195 [Pseudoduganella namucuonensis]